MKTELFKYFMENDSSLYVGDFETAYKKFANYPRISEMMAEDFYANQRKTKKMPTGFKGYDLEDFTEIKTATRSWDRSKDKYATSIKIDGLANKDEAKLIIIIYNDTRSRTIEEVRVTPDDIRNADGSMPNYIVISDPFKANFADKIKILKTY